MEIPVLDRFWRRRPPKVFGIGLIKTGTTSLGAALEQLGYRHTHERRNKLLSHVERGELREIYRWVDQHDSFEDWPWPFLYRALSSRYPDSLFVLTRRADPARWLESVKRHAERFGPSPGRELFFGHAMPQGHEYTYLRCYREHNDAVRSYFARHPGRLLEVCWEEGHGWQELAEFLGERVPDRAFPELNTARQRIAK